jgi:hypothetical protein
VSEDIELASDLKTDINSRVTIHPRVTIEALKAASRIRFAESHSSNPRGKNLVWSSSPKMITHLVNCLKNSQNTNLDF